MTQEFNDLKDQELRFDILRQVMIAFDQLPSREIPEVVERFYQYVKTGKVVEKW